MNPAGASSTKRTGRIPVLLGGSLLLCSLIAAASDRAVKEQVKARELNPPTWIVPATDTGPDIPAVGRSLFDHFLLEGARREGLEFRVPFPFSVLREQIMRELRQPESGRRGVRQVLIPLGRSLQRSAAAPEFFRYPRVVLAVDGETKANADELGLFLKDRLYLGYLEKPGVLEVISYNEEAGRFEFQVVTDYRAGGTPRVSYANRAVCIACHQNRTPIFARPLWGETNADPAIAALLAAEQREFYGIPTRVDIDEPNAIDDASDRANLIPAVQLLWQQGCGKPLDAATVRSCRARVLRFALQYRLTGQQAFHRADNPEWKALMRAFESNWSARWPGGLLLSSPDVPNRVPVATTTPILSGPQAQTTALSTAERRVHQQRHIPSAFEPLQPRAPLVKWNADQAALALVAGVADFFAESDIERLDKRLFEIGAEGSLPSTTLRADCLLTSRQRGEQGERLSFNCGESGGGLQAQGRLYLKRGRILRGSIDRLTLSASGSIANLSLQGSVIEASTGGRVVQLRADRGHRHARLTSGRSVGALKIHWSRTTGMQPQADKAAASDHAQMELELLADFDPLIEAIDLLSRSHGGDALSSKPLRRAAVMQALFQQLGIPGVTLCCLGSDGLPPAHAESVGVHSAVDELVKGPESIFYRHCALCHRSGERFPPNFLTGDKPQVRAKLAHCAERLYLRLSMWGVPEAERTKTPMPPLHAFPLLGLDPQRWQDDESELAALQTYARELLQKERGKPPLLKELVAQGYENLRPCLAQAQ